MERLLDWLRREPYLFYNHETGSYLKVLVLPHLWKFGIDPYHQYDTLFVSFGPFHVSVTHNSYWCRNDSVAE